MPVDADVHFYCSAGDSVSKIDVHDGVVRLPGCLGGVEALLLEAKRACAQQRSEALL